MFGLITSFCLLHGIQGLHFYVSTLNGNDDNSGLNEHDAFQTLNRAKLEIRDIKIYNGGSITENIYINIDKGVYYESLHFSNLDSGNDDHYVIWRALDKDIGKDSVTMSGGQKIDKSLFYSCQSKFDNNADTVHTQLTDHHEQNTDQLKEYQTKIDEMNKSMEDLKIECENLTKLNQQYMEQNNTLKTRIQTKDEQITELTKDRDDWEGKHDQTHQNLLERLQQINQLNSDIANYKHQIELVQAGNEPTKVLKSSNHMKTLRNVFHDSSGDLLLGGDSTTNITVDKGDGFYQQSNTNILTGIYGPSTTNIVTERDTGFAVDLNTQTTDRGKKRDSIDGDNNASLQHEVFGLQQQLQEERNNHLSEMETKENELEKVNKARSEMENEIKELREEIDRLKEQSSQQQDGGCKDCIIM